MSNYTQTYPLAGKTILVTRALGSSSAFRKILEEKGATVLELPALVIKPPSSWEMLDEAIAHIGKYNWLILTSVNGVAFFWQRLEKARKNEQDLKHLKIAVVGKKTANCLAKYNLKADFIPPDFVADSMAENFPEPLSGQNILFPRVETGGREVLVQQLKQEGANITEVPAYESGCPDEMDEVVVGALERKAIDIITFASSKTVRNFHHLLHQQWEKDQNHNLSALLEQVAIASIGPQTSATCQELFNRVDIEAQEYTLEGLTKAISKISKKEHL